MTNRIGYTFQTIFILLKTRVIGIELFIQHPWSEDCCTNLKSADHNQTRYLDRVMEPDEFLLTVIIQAFRSRRNDGVPNEQVFHNGVDP